MNKVDIVQNHKITILVAVVTGLSALTGIMLYFEKRRHNKVQSEIDELDKNIKQLQLERLKKGK